MANSVIVTRVSENPPPISKGKFYKNTSDVVVVHESGSGFNATSLKDGSRKTGDSAIATIENWLSANSYEQLTEGDTVSVEVG